MTTEALLKILTCFSLSKLEVAGGKIMSPFIVGGYYSNIEDFPHVAFLHIRCKVGFISFCGASILNQAVMLTAAHCLYECENKNFTIKAYTGHVKKYKGDEYNVLAYKIHEGYNPKNYSNDIAMLVMKEDIVFKSGVKRILLLKHPPEYKKARIAGWGWIDDQSTKTELLKHTSQVTISQEACAKKLVWTPVGTICGYNPSGSHPQRGDSGSALVIHKNIQIGVASYFRRNHSNTTLVYTYVPFFYDWINRTTREIFCKYKKSKVTVGTENKTTTTDKTTTETMKLHYGLYY